MQDNDLNKISVRLPRLEDRQPAPNIDNFVIQNGNRLLVTALPPIGEPNVKYLRMADSVTVTPGKDPSLTDDSPVSIACSAAKSALANSFSRVHAYLEGGIHDVEMCLRLTIAITATPGFTSLHLISEPVRGMARVFFDQKASPAATVIGVSALPAEVFVMVEAEYVLKDGATRRTS